MIDLIIKVLLFAIMFSLLVYCNGIHLPKFKNKSNGLFNFFLFFIVFSTLASFNSYASGTESMDLNFITEFYMPIVIVACLIVGYCIKHIKALEKYSNDYIPSTMALLGAILGCLTAGLSLESVVYGALSGLASTGLHQAFTRIIDKTKE